MLAVFLAAGAAAQSYPALHVIALSQRSDRSSVAPNGVFHVTIHAKIAGRRERLDELILGSFENCEIISNETVRTVVPDGTDFIERLTVQALAPGEAAISPAYIDAQDPAIGKPMRFSSNPIRVEVTGPAPLESGLRAVAATARRLLFAFALVAGFIAAVFVLGVIFVRGRKRRPAPPPKPVRVHEPIAPVAPTSTANERLLRAADDYRRDRSDASLAAVRSELFGLAGVARGTTLVDALRALGDRDRPLRSALLAAERAAFAPAGERDAAGDEMLAAIQAYAGRRPANVDAWTR